MVTAGCLLSALLSQPHPAHTAVETAADPGELEPRFPVGWRPDIPVWLMEPAVPDQILTQPAHQRRGRGSVVMTALTNAAVEEGCTRAVLGASAEGRALYRALGWHEVGRHTGMHYRPAKKPRRVGGRYR